MSNSELKGIAGEPLYEYCPSCGWLLDQDGHCANEECKHPNNTHNCNIHPADYGRICDLALSERHQRLVEAAKDLLNAISGLCGDEYSCFSTCSLANECDKDSGNECLLVARLKAALGGEE
jgi:hypothetical protein